MQLILWVTYGYTLNKSKMTCEILLKNRCSEIIKLAQFWKSHVFYIVCNNHSQFRRPDLKNKLDVPLSWVLCLVVYLHLNLQIQLWEAFQVWQLCCLHDHLLLSLLAFYPLNSLCIDGRSYHTIHGPAICGKKRTKTCSKILNYCKTDIRDQVKNNKNTREYRVTSTKRCLNQHKFSTVAPVTCNIIIKHTCSRVRDVNLLFICRLAST